MDARARAELHDLARRDDELAAAGARLTELETAVARIRDRAEAIDAFFAAYPERESRARAAIATAEEDLERRRSELAAAERDLAAVRSDDERVLAEKAIARARDHVADAESGLLRARSACEQLEGDAAELPTELAELETEARADRHGELAGSPTPGHGPPPARRVGLACARRAVRRAQPARRAARAADPGGERARIDAARRVDLRLDRRPGAPPGRGASHGTLTCPRCPLSSVGRAPPW